MANTQAQVTPIAGLKGTDDRRSKEEVQDWLVAVLADLLDIDPDAIDLQMSYDRYGLDSSAAIGLTDSLGTWLGTDLVATLLYDYPTIEALSEHLVQIGVAKT
jgi:acyl carrier protein